MKDSGNAASKQQMKVLAHMCTAMSEPRLQLDKESSFAGLQRVNITNVGNPA